MALERRDETAPAGGQGRQVELLGRVVRDEARRTTGGRRAIAAAHHEVQVAVEAVVVGRERPRVARVLAGHVVTGVELVRVVGAVAGRRGAGAHLDLGGGGGQGQSFEPGNNVYNSLLPGGWLKTYTDRGPLLDRANHRGGCGNEKCKKDEELHLSCWLNCVLENRSSRYSDVNESINSVCCLRDCGLMLRFLCSRAEHEERSLLL